MTGPMKYEEAKERVEQLKGFYIHLAAYVVVNAFLVVTNLLTSYGDWWFHWPLFGWAIGLAIHGMGVFYKGGFFGKSWEERKIKELMGEDAEKDGEPKA